MTFIAIDLPDRQHRMYATVEGDTDRPGVVLIHGMACTADDILLVDASRALIANGFAVLRLNLYGDQADARKMNECTMATHLDDINASINWMQSRQGLHPVSVAGHSLGAMLALGVNSAGVASVVLWDATHPRRGDFNQRDDARFDVTSQQWCLSWQGTSLLLNGEFVTSWADYPAERLAAGLNRPLLVVGASNSPRTEAAHRYYAVAQDPKQLVLMPEANHWFTEQSSFDTLITATLDWVNTHGR